MTVVVAVWNEATALRPLMDALRAQTVTLREVIFADGGSIDGSQSIIAEEGANSPFAVRLLPVFGKIAKGRNAAIRVAETSIIAITDADCIPHKDWLQRLTEPFASGANAVAGSYSAQTSSALERAIATFTWVPQRAGQRFLPSHRSVAFRKELWAEIGGYREDIDSGEDTLFDLEVEKRGGFAQAVAATVLWKPRKTVGAAMRQQFFYGGGDGQARIQFLYHAAIAFYICALVGAATLRGVLDLVAFVVSLSIWIWFIRKHLILFPGSIGDIPLTIGLAILLPFARIAGYCCGLSGVSVRKLLNRS